MEEVIETQRSLCRNAPQTQLYRLEPLALMDVLCKVHAFGRMGSSSARCNWHHTCKEIRLIVAREINHQA